MWGIWPFVVSYLRGYIYFVNHFPGASLSGKSTILVNLLKNINMFNYKVDKVILFYQHLSPVYTVMQQVLTCNSIPFEMKRYSELILSPDYLSQLREDSDKGYNLVLFDDCTQFVEDMGAFNNLIHTARHSGLIFVLVIHGIIFSKAPARRMVRGNIKHHYKYKYL